MEAVITWKERELFPAVRNSLFFLVWIGSVTFRLDWLLCWGQISIQTGDVQMSRRHWTKVNPVGELWTVLFAEFLEVRISFSELVTLRGEVMRL